MLSKLKDKIEEFFHCLRRDNPKKPHVIHAVIALNTITLEI
jgi:hypothetical protein